MDTLQEMTLDQLRAPGGESRTASWARFVISLALFAWVSGARTDPTALGLLVGVLLFHELGHLAAMKAFGYADLRMFFIPFFGAAVSGRAASVAAWKRGVVSLAGPVPGIVLAAAALHLGLATGHPLVAQLVVVALVVNLLNLLPLLPLDGGKLFEVVVLGRGGRGELAAVALSGVTLIAGAFVLHDVVIGLVGFMILSSFGRRDRFLRIVETYCREVPEPAARLEDASDTELDALYRACCTFSVGQPRLLAATMREVHDRATARRPEPRAAAGLIASYAGALAFGVITVWPLVALATASDTLDREERIDALTLRRPASFSVTRNGGKLLLERGSAALIVQSQPLLPGQTAKAALGAVGVDLVLTVPPVAGETPALGHGRCAGVDGPTMSWHSQVNGQAAPVHVCAAIHDGRAYSIIVLSDSEKGSTVAASIVHSAHF
jgi:Zn-dependent protease